MDVNAFFTYLAKLPKTESSSGGGCAPIVARMAKIGLVPGAGLHDPSKLGALDKEAIKAVR